MQCLGFLGIDDIIVSQEEWKMFSIQLGILLAGPKIKLLFYLRDLSMKSIIDNNNMFVFEYLKSNR